jgi:hypothetical protein
MTTNGTSFSKTFNDKKMGKFDDKNLGMTQNGSRLQWTSFVFFLKEYLANPTKSIVYLHWHHFIILSIRPLM